MTINIDFNQLINTAIIAGVNGATMLIVTQYMKKLIEKLEKRHKNDGDENQ